MSAPRYLEKMTSIDGGTSYTFPLNKYKGSSSQALRIPTAPIAGAHYPFDFLGTGMALRDGAQEQLSVVLTDPTPSNIDTALDTLMWKLHLIGLGKLYVVDSSAAERWAYARLASMPGHGAAAGRNNMLDVDLDFLRLSDWFGTSQQTPNSGALTTSPVTFIINNPGNARVYAVAVKLHANASGGFTNPQIDNTTNGYSWSSTRDSASNGDELIVDAGANTVKFNGSDDYALFTRGASQVGYMALEPGNNTIMLTCGGTPNVTVTFTFYGAYY